MAASFKNIPLGDLDITDELVGIICGPVDCGKSTLLGILSNPTLRENPSDQLVGALDDGDGKTRKYVARYPHEIETGRTSAISYMPILFDKKHWQIDSSRTVTLTDLCGHEKYLKTTVTGMCSADYNFGLTCIGRIANKINPMAKEHIKIMRSLGKPFAIVINKIDLQTEDELKNTIKKIIKYTAQWGINKPLIVKNDADACLAAKLPSQSQWLPFFLTSCKTGYGILRLMRYMSAFPAANPTNSRNMFMVDAIYQVPGHGTIVTGNSGIDISVGDRLMIGPYSAKGLDIFAEVIVRSIHDNYKNTIPTLAKKRRGCLCIKFQCSARDRTLYKDHIKPGMVVVANTHIPKISRTFEAKVHIFSGHHTTITDGFTSMCNIGNIRMAAKFKLKNAESAKSGDNLIVELNFKHNICPAVDSEFIFREGMSVGYGQITAII